MTPLSVFGLFAVTAMLITYALEQRSSWFVLALPPRVIPTAGLCVGWPAEEGYVTPRLGLATTLHEDRYGTDDLRRQIEAYDRRREQRRPYRRQRNPERWGTAEAYGWSEDKARQYAEPLRADFGAFVRSKGFRLE